MNASDACKAHRILSRLFEGRAVLNEEREFLRNALPERPRQMTLKEIHVMVNDYYTNESDERGYLPVGGKHVRPWMNELREQLRGLVRAQEDVQESSPLLPEGMRLAEHKYYGRVVVSPLTDTAGDYACFRLTDDDSWGAYITFANDNELKFIDAEPAKPAHPEFLETEADYTNAPVGTVVARDNGLPWVKEKSNYWTRPDAAKSDYGMSLGSRRVLRWGWGE